jgi:hypothetical protein
MDEQSISAEDRLDILDLLGRYFVAVDSGDPDAILKSFTHDGCVRYDTGECFSGPDGLRAFATRAVGGDNVRGRMHLNFPLYFRREGNVVVLSSYLSSAQWRLPDPPRAFGSLRYIEDRCIKTSEGWRIQERSISLWNDQSVASLRQSRADRDA